MAPSECAVLTHEEGITDDPLGVTSAAPDIRAERKVEDTTEAHAATSGEAAEVHVVIAHGPCLPTKGERDVERSVASCAQRYVSAPKTKNRVGRA